MLSWHKVGKREVLMPQVSQQAPSAPKSQISERLAKLRERVAQMKGRADSHNLPKPKSPPQNPKTVKGREIEL